MTDPGKTSNERNVIITRFVLIYVISIFCGIIPLFYLFNLPDKAISQLTASKLSAKGRQENLDRFKQLYSELDKYIADNKIETEYDYGNLKVFGFAKDSIGDNNLYKPLFLQISALYSVIKKKSQDPVCKAELDQLKTDYKNLQDEKKAVDAALSECKIRKGILEGSK